MVKNCSVNCHLHLYADDRGAEIYFFLAFINLE